MNRFESGRVGEPSPPTLPPGVPADGGLHRSGAVARMLGMPVATLRVWERRYGLSRPALSAGGQRLYSAADVQRLALVRQLADGGHAIGRLATLDLVQLQHVASTHAQASATVARAAGPAAAAAPPRRAWRLAVVGVALRTRLQRPALSRGLGRPVMLLGPFADLAQAAAALGGDDLDALLVHAPQLHEGWLDAVAAAAPALAGVPKAVFYGFAADAVCEALASAGTALLREPQPDAVVAQWLAGVAAASAPRPPPAGHPVPATPQPVPPRRWDDAALAGFAGLSSAMACECPRHVAELLVQLSQFEAYSTECAHRSAADAELHAYLQRVAAAARAHFETALEHVARHEGLSLPASPARGRPGALPGPPSSFTDH